jgi:sialate O-acetylesterase
MTRLHSILTQATATALLCLASPEVLALNLPRVFSDNMVLQRDLPVKVWGWADPGQAVEVSFAGQKKSAQAESNGRWTVTLDPLKASAEPADLVVVAGAQQVSVKNVLVGEVWVCSGQSNMEWTLGGTHNAKEAIAAATDPLIRHFKVRLVTSPKPLKDVQGEWVVCSPATAGNFTAVGYHFGRELRQKLGVPVGLLNTSWGGTRIEPWTDPLGFAVSPKLKDISDLIANADQTHLRNQAAKLDEIEAWVKESRQALQKGAEPTASPGGLPDHPLSKADRPTAIYNAMVAPLVPFGIRGAIWYQGESNNGEGMLYLEKMKALIGSWRRLWNLGDFPFLYVQLAPFRYGRPEALPGIWEAQQAALSIPNAGMAVITDIGNVTDIHPRNKEEVGRRLSLWALARTYGVANLEYSGPLYKSLRVDGPKAILGFDHADGLKSLDGKPLTWFTIAGEDRKFVEAKAEIAGRTVVVSSDAVPHPTAVRFGWHETAEPNLGNGAGLPASPFRTDQW